MINRHQIGFDHRPGAGRQRPGKMQMLLQPVQAVKYSLADEADVLPLKISVCSIVVRKRHIVPSQIHSFRGLPGHHPAITHFPLFLFRFLSYFCE